MKLTNATEQALAIMAMLAMQKREIPVSSESIYTKLAVSPSYVRKLLRKLVVARLISAVSGNNGGFYLEKETEEISLLEIVEAIEGPMTSFPNMGVLQRAFSGFDDYAENGHKIVSSFFSEADRLWEERLRRVSVREVLDTVFKGETIPLKNWNEI